MASRTRSSSSPTTSGFQEDVLDYYDDDLEAAKELWEEAPYANGFDVVLPEITGYQDEYTAITVQRLALSNIRAQVPPTPRQEALRGSLAASSHARLRDAGECQRMRCRASCRRMAPSIP